MIRPFLRYGTLIAFVLLFAFCEKETPEQEAPTTDISAKFTDPVMRDHIGDLIRNSYFNKELIDNKVSIQNVLHIVALNIARNYKGALNVSSLAGIQYMKGLKIIDLRNQDTLVGTYDLRQMSELYYLRIAGAERVKFVISSNQRDRIMSTSGVFDGNENQVIVK